MTLLLIIDPQVDFHEGGSLEVSGALQDTTRLSEMINYYNSEIDSVVVTLDSHHREHIAHPLFWQDSNGDEPPLFERITHEDVLAGRWVPRDSIHMKHCLKYTNALEEKGRFVLTIWPMHCLIDSPGHDVLPLLQEALDRWAAARPGREVKYVMKGMNDLTEMYSALEAEVALPEDPLTQLNHSLLNHLKEAKKVLVAGQALSHCVNYTVRDLLRHWAPRNPQDIVLLTDGCSSVPGCEEAGRQFLQDIQEAGATLSTTKTAFPN